MQTRDVVGFCLVPITLLIAAGALGASTVGSVPWVCALLAASALILVLVSLCLGRTPTALPARSLSLVYVVSLVVAGLGVVLRLYFTEELAAQRTLVLGVATPRKPDAEFLMTAAVYEGVSFAAVLLCLFAAARWARGGGRGPAEPGPGPGQP